MNPAWMGELTRAVWAESGLPASALPRVSVRAPARSTRGFINYGAMPYRIVVRHHEDRAVMRSTLLHELAHGVHRMHASDAATCRCAVRCEWDAHGATFKAHLARLEHRHMPGVHSRWGLAGCRGLSRVPAGTPWHAEIPCPASEGASAVAAVDLREATVLAVPSGGRGAGAGPVQGVFRGFLEQVERAVGRR